MEQKKINFELETTVFKNIDDSDFVFHLNNQPIEVGAGEEKILPAYVAQHGAKHLIDKILQNKHGVKDTLRDTPLRKDLYAQILPQLAEIADVKPATPEEFQKFVKEQLDRQEKLLSEFMGASNRDSEIEALKKEIDELKKGKEEKVVKKK